MNSPLCGHGASTLRSHRPKRCSTQLVPAPVVTTEVANRSSLRYSGPTRCCSINLIHGIAQILFRCAVEMTTPTG